MGKRYIRHPGMDCRDPEHMDVRIVFIMKLIVMRPQPSLATGFRQSMRNDGLPTTIHIEPKNFITASQSTQTIIQQQTYEYHQAKPIIIKEGFKAQSFISMEYQFLLITKKSSCD